jgi:hypothetical protein
MASERGHPRSQSSAQRSSWVDSAITAWALDLSAGHPTDHGTIDEFLNDCDFLVIITKAIDGEISCEIHATSKCAGSA